MSTPQQERQIHISDFCARVYRQNEQKCGTTTTKLGAARRNYFGEPDPASDFDDAAAEAAWSYRWGTQTPVSHVNSITPDDDVYEGFDQKARPMDSLPAYLAERSGITYEDAVEYIYRAGHGCHWGGKKRVSGEVWPDITAIARIVVAHFKDDAMRELLAWFAREYPDEAAEMGLLDSDVEQDLRDAGWQGEPDEPPVEQPKEVAAGDGPILRARRSVPEGKTIHSPDLMNASGKEITKHATAIQIAEHFGWGVGRVRTELSKAYWGPLGKTGTRARPDKPFWTVNKSPLGRGANTQYLWVTELVVAHLKSIFQQQP